MIELKSEDRSTQDKSSCGCSSASPAPERSDFCSPKSEASIHGGVAETVMIPLGIVRKVSTELSFKDRWEHFKCRVGAFRNNYSVPPGLYAVGRPDKNSDVLVTANYKFSFDALRRELKDMNAWILVLDTKGINVWCAAGKGTFGTDELIRRIASVRLDKMIAHRRIILPQLGAPGVSAHKVREATGFRVRYGPVRAQDISEYIRAGYEASREMRTIGFSLTDRLVLTPMEINPAMKKYPLYALLILFIFGLQPSGIFFKDAFVGAMPFLLLGLIAVLAGAFLTPFFLPFIPFRSFAVKGWIVGMLSTLLSERLFNSPDPILTVFTYLFFPLASSYIALQFTGSTTFTGMSGVKKELKITIPAYIFFVILSVVLLAAFKLNQWGVI